MKKRRYKAAEHCSDGSSRSERMAEQSGTRDSLKRESQEEHLRPTTQDSSRPDAFYWRHSVGRSTDVYGSRFGTGQGIARTAAAVLNTSPRPLIAVLITI